MASDTAATASELVDCLQRQADQFREFLDLLARQRQALVARDTTALERVVADLEAAFAAARHLEQHRRVLTSRLAAADENTEEPLRLAEIRDLVAASDASRLDQLLATLGELQQEIEHRQKLNRALIEKSMRCTSETLQWMTDRVHPRGSRMHTPAAPPGAGLPAVPRRS